MGRAVRRVLNLKGEVQKDVVGRRESEGRHE